MQPLRFLADDPRLRRLNDRPIAPKGEWVLYWMQAARRGEDNAALAYAVERANELGVPCVVYEALRPDYPHASDRIHRFVLEGARDTAARLAARGIAYTFFLPRSPGEARGVLHEMTKRARLVVSDDFPSFVVPRHNEAAAAQTPCAFFVVDDCTVVPMALLAKAEGIARTVRPKVLRALEAWLRAIDQPGPRVRAPGRLDLPFEPVDLSHVNLDQLVASCAIDHNVAAVDETRGGLTEASGRLNAFIRGALASYDIDRNDPSRQGGSRLSAYLHFGMISARTVALSARAWGRGAALAAFLEQLLVRRSLSYSFARTRPDHAHWSALPPWARTTLEAHAKDKRYAELTVDDLEQARSPDALWNASMRELRARGTVQPYARMLWGKLPILWMRHPKDAHAAMVYLNDKWALDGRDPNGYANVSWCFGLHDRPWPARAVFGNVRCMTSGSARKKLDFEDYVRTWAAHT